MKKTLYLVGLMGLLACGSGAKNSTADSATAGADTAAAALAAMPDPDTTDSIPASQYGINSSSEQTARLVRLTLQDLFKKDLQEDLIPKESRRFVFFEYSLNDDARKEIFVGLIGPYFCGSGGCTMYLLDSQGNVITRFTVVDYPVVISNQLSHGWRDLIIYSGGKNRLLKFNGKTYPSNPSVQPVYTQTPGDDLPRALNFMNEPYPWFTF